MKKLTILLLLVGAAGCASPRYALSPEHSILTASKRYTMFFANCKKSTAPERSFASASAAGEKYTFRERAAVLVNYLRGCDFEAFHVDQVSNVVVAVGQFDEVNSTKAQRMVHDIKNHPKLRVLKVYWKPRQKRVTVMGNPALARGHKIKNLSEERRKPFRMLEVKVLKESVGVKKRDDIMKTTVIKGPGVPVSELAK